MGKVGQLRLERLRNLAEAIDSAQKLAWQLRTRSNESSDLRDLYNRLEAARLEIQSMCQHETNELSDDDWLKALGWSSSLVDRDD